MPGAGRRYALARARKLFRQRGAGEQTPAYAIAFELYDNGISRALTLDHDEFEITGAMSTLQIRDTPACR